MNSKPKIWRPPIASAQEKYAEIPRQINSTVESLDQGQIWLNGLKVSSFKDPSTVWQPMR